MTPCSFQNAFLKIHSLTQYKICGHAMGKCLFQIQALEFVNKSGHAFVPSADGTSMLTSISVKKYPYFSELKKVLPVSFCSPFLSLCHLYFVPFFFLPFICHLVIIPISVNNLSITDTLGASIFVDLKYKSEDKVGPF